MITISVCMIVKNEEAVLARCLESARQIAAELGGIDTGSSDRTKEIAAEYTDRIFDFAWEDDFSRARNFSFAQATMDYCMWLDADDILLPEDIEKIRALKQTLDPRTDIVMMRYHTSFDENGRPSFTYYRERLIRRAAGFRWEGAVHEVIAPAGHIVYSEAAVTHRKTGRGDPDRNLRIFEKLLARGEQLDPRQQFYYARELYYHSRFREAIGAFRAFLDGGAGWIENNIDACRQLAYCYYGLKQDREALRALLMSLEYDCPRAETCCDIGGHFFGRERYREAIFWYDLAARCKRNDTSGGFILPDCYDYIPYLQLCVCYDRLGDAKTAEQYNELAAACRPGSVEVAANRRYFAQKRAEKAK